MCNWDHPAVLLSYHHIILIGFTSFWIMAHFDCNSTTNIWDLMESMVFTDCEPLRAMLNLRQDWSSRNEMRGRRTWSPCEIVRDSWFLAETSIIVRNMRGRKASLRFNASNDTHSRKQRRFIVLRTKRYVSLVEELLGDLLVKKSLYDTFHPTSLSTAIFFLRCKCDTFPISTLSLDQWKITEFEGTCLAASTAQFAWSLAPGSPHATKWAAALQPFVSFASSS